MQVFRLVALTGVLCIVCILSACDASTPSQVHTGKMRVKEQMVTETLDVAHMDPARLHVLAENIARNARGPVSLTVSYLAGDAARARAAEKRGRQYKNELKQLGVSNVSMVTVPVTDKQYADKAVVAYQALTASAPKDCARIPGHQGSGNMADADEYQFGCETKTLISKMIVDPSDLLGKAGSQDVESRRAGATVEGYKAGTANKPMTGFQASNIGSQ